jgi:hypothetical protein
MYLRGQMNLSVFLNVKLLEMKEEFSVKTFDTVQFLGLSNGNDEIGFKDFRNASLVVKGCSEGKGDSGGNSGNSKSSKKIENSEKNENIENSESSKNNEKNEIIEIIENNDINNSNKNQGNDISIISLTYYKRIT